MLKELVKKIFIRPFDPEAFSYAAYVGDFLYVEKTIRNHPEAVHWANKDGRTALHLTPHWSVASALIAAGADIERSEPAEGLRPLHQALRRANGDVARLLLDKGADIHVADAQCRLPVHHAAQSFSAQQLEMLLKKGADINARCKNGFTPLMLAAMEDRTEAVQMLLSRGADVTLTNTKGETADQLARHYETSKLLEGAKKKNDGIRRAAAEQSALRGMVEELTEGSAAPIAVKKPLKLQQRPATA